MWRVTQDLDLFCGLCDSDRKPAVYSADALQGKGTIVIRTGESDGGAWVEVEDNGPGIPAEIKSRILEPFFTTKGDVGTGLGLSIVYAFTQRYGGKLDVWSEIGEGARFRMWFPLGRLENVLE